MSLVTLGKEADSSRLLCLPVNSICHLLRRNSLILFIPRRREGYRHGRVKYPSFRVSLFQTNWNCDVEILKKQRTNKQTTVETLQGGHFPVTLATFLFQDVFEIVTVMLKPCPTALTLWPEYIFHGATQTDSEISERLTFVCKGRCNGWHVNAPLISQEPHNCYFLYIYFA